MDFHDLQVTIYGLFVTGSGKGVSMKNREAIIAVLMLLPLWSGSAAAEEDEIKMIGYEEIEMPRVHAPAVLDTFDAGAYQYQLAVKACKEQRNQETGREETICPVVVNLLKGGKTVDTKALPLSVEMPKFTRQYISPTWYAPLYNHDPTQQVWRSGYEQWRVSILARPVQLDDRQTGLLVTQNYGFERVNSLHVLFTEQHGKLKTIWSYTGKEMFDQSAVYPVEVKGKPYLLYWQDGRKSEWLWEHNAFLLRWNPNKQKIESTKLPTAGIPLYAVSIEFYDPDNPTPGEFSCERNHDLLDTQRKSYLDHIGTPFIHTITLATEDYPGLPQDKPAMWGNVFFTLEEAKKYQEGLRQCEPPTDSEIIVLN